MTPRLDDGDANRLLEIAVANVQRDYPVHWTHLIHSADDLRTQRERHPVFAGSFDWHSCVHQTWLAVRLLRLRPALPAADSAVDALNRLLTPEGVATEAEFFRDAGNAHWERPYGWAWVLVLDAELRAWARTGGEVGDWVRALQPLREVLRERWLGWLAREPRPIRAGIHQNSAFSIGLVLDAARATRDEELADSCVAAATRWYAQDCGYGGFEPDAADFLSPALTEADLMRRVLAAEEFSRWLDGFLPDLDTPRWAGLREPVVVDDPADPYGSHLAGLALSRAWGWAGIAHALPSDHRYPDLAATAAAEHWLGTFATYLDLGALVQH